MAALYIILYTAIMGETERAIWDDQKGDIKLHRRGIDFAGLDEVFDGRFALTGEDRRRDYGERRFNIIVEINEVILNVTVTPRDGKQRIVAARPANR